MKRDEEDVENPRPFRSGLTTGAAGAFSAACGFLGLALVVGVALALLQPEPAQASPQGLAVEVAQAAPAAVGIYSGTADVVVACDSDGEVITISGFASTVAWSCYVAGTTAVFFGASAAAGQSGETAQTLVTTATGLGVCEGGLCANGSAPAIWRSPMGRAGIFACRTSAGSVNVRCNGVKP